MSALAITLAVLIGALALLLTAAQAQQATKPNVPCTCRYQGEDYSIGDSICLGSGTSTRVATCSMVLNNTSWKFSTTPCPQATLTVPERKPIEHASPEKPETKPIF